MRALTHPLLFGLALAGCLGDVEVPPEPPKLTPISSPTQVARQSVRGTKPKGTAVLDSGAVVVAEDELETFSFEKELRLGENRVDLTSRRPSGLESRKHTEAVIVYEPLCPGRPMLDRYTSPTPDNFVQLRGQKPIQTSLWLDDVELLPLGDETTFDHVLALPNEGPSEHVLQTRDAKDRASDALRFVIVRDSVAPVIAAQYPEAGATGVPRNALISIRFGELLAFPDGVPDSAAITLSDQNGALQTLLVSNVESHALTLIPLGPGQPDARLDPSQLYTVTIDRTKIPDIAGNFALSAPITFDFTTAALPDAAPPPAPVLDAVPATIAAPTIVLSGSKAADTSIRVNGREAVSIDTATTWSFELELPIGTSSISVAARSPGHAETFIPALSIDRSETRPPAPVLAADTPESVPTPSVALRGTKAPGTSILLGGEPVVCGGPETDWSFIANLRPGGNELRIEALDEAGVRSEPVIVVVRYERQYDGPVPDGYTLKIELELRDLANVAPISDEFETGSNNYGLDVWIEGPLEDGETCRFVGGERQDIKYVGTIEHYIGTKAQHRVPFVDDDYRGTDYLAALITAGAFTFHGLSPGSPRREASGREVSGLLAGITEDDLRQNIDCFGAVGVDTCTQATVRNGRRAFAPWTPRKRNSPGLLEQGEYLLFILINLDRNGSWLSGNDYETCWGDPLHTERGMHRIVRRISLGADAYSESVPREEELFGPDREGSGKLYYLTEAGVTISWGP